MFGRPKRKRHMSRSDELFDVQALLEEVGLLPPPTRFVCLGQLWPEPATSTENNTWQTFVDTDGADIELIEQEAREKYSNRGQPRLRLEENSPRRISPAKFKKYKRARACQTTMRTA
jgi:hypothetical protein